MIHSFDAADVGQDGWLSGFLHDAECAWNDESFNLPQATMSIMVRRRYYEEPHFHRALGLFPETKFRVVPSRLCVYNVTAASLEPTRVGSRLWPTFDYAELRGLELSFFFEGGDIKLSLSRWEPIVLQDTGPPGSHYDHSYLGYTLEDFQEMAQALQARRSDA